MIRKIFIIVLLLLCQRALFAQEDDYNRGVTLITHGFSFTGNLNEDFVEFGKEVLAASGGTGTVYLLSSKGEYERIHGSGKGNEEIIIVFDWANLSNDFTGKNKYGDLEGAADFLFAKLMAPPPELGISGDELLGKRLHFIGHSRGAILLMQLCHRLQRFKSKVNIEQLTFLDPHPATPFSDVGGILNGYQTSLPGVLGDFSFAGSFIIDESIHLKIPANVTRFDGYFRRDTRYEEIFSNNGTALALASFDGANVYGTDNHHELTENVIAFLADPLGGSHSAVVKWYRGTIPESSIDWNTFYWYTPWVGNFFSENDSRNSVGYFHSRIGSKGANHLLPPAMQEGVKSSIQEMDVAINSRQGFPGGIQRVFNGKFIYGPAGWRNRGGVFPSSAMIIESSLDRFNSRFTNYLSLEPAFKSQNDDPFLKHNFFYFGTDSKGNAYQTLSFEVYPEVMSLQNSILVKFYDTKNSEILRQVVRIDNTPSTKKLIQIPIPESLRRNTGTFSIENISTSDVNINIGGFELVTSSPTVTSSVSLNGTFVRSEQSVHLNWSDFTIDESGYIVEKATSENGHYTPIGETLPPNTNFFEDKELLPNVTFWYRVKSLSPTLGEVYTNKESVVIADRPPAPTYISASVVNGRDINMVWNDATDVETGYELYYKMASSGGYSLLETLPANTTSYTLANVAANTTISFVVRCRELKFVSEPSPEASAIVGKVPVNSRITKVEAYFDNTDPGPGKGIDINTVITNEDAIATTNPNLDISDLSDGLHTVTVRAQDSKGYWSQQYTQPFLKLKQQVAAAAIEGLQYTIDFSGNNADWVDVDVSALSGANEQLTIQITPQRINSLTDGVHVITIRAKDNRGYTSNYFQQAFLKLNGVADGPKVITLEYSVDNGLLIGNGTAVVLTPGEYANVSVDLPPIANGKHYISFKAKDDGGYWSNISIDSFVVYDQRFCEKNATVQFSANIPNGKTYYWQQNDSNGWKTIANGGIYEGARTSVLSLMAPPTDWYGYQFRCVVNGIPLSPYTLKFGDEWTGAADDDWHNPANWCCYGVPDANTDVYVSPSTIVKPRIKTSAVCRSLLLKSGSNIIIEPGAILEVTGSN